MAELHDAKVPFRDNDNIGIGIDSASGDRKGLVVNPVTGRPKGAGGSTSQFSITRIFQTSDLETALNINADASAGIASFASASARFDFAKQMRVQSSSVFMTVTASVMVASESIDVPVLADQPAGAGASSTVDNPTVFAERYGDMFVRSLERGGFFVGVLQIDTASQSEADQVAVSLGGSYLLFSADASTKMQNLTSQFRSSLFVHQYSEGGSILQISDQHDPLQLVASVSTFLKSFQDSPDVVAVAFNCSLAPVAIASGPLPPNEAAREHARDVIVECARRRSATMDLLNQVQFISDHNSDYDFSNGSSMDAITKSIVGFQSDLDIIARCASNAIDHTSADAPMPPQFAANLMPPVPYPTVMPNPLPMRKPRRPPVFDPSPNQFSPKRGPAAETDVVLFGGNFDAGGASVSFGSVPASILGQPSATQISAHLPQMAAAMVKITVATAAGSVTSDDTFEVMPEGTVFVPFVEGKDLPKAEEILGESGLVARRIGRFGLFVDQQNPSAGTPVSRNSIVTLTMKQP